jgi:hypothetical protein
MICFFPDEIHSFLRLQLFGWFFFKMSLEARSRVSEQSKSEQNAAASSTTTNAQKTENGEAQAVISP